MIVNDLLSPSGKAPFFCIFVLMRNSQVRFIIVFGAIATAGIIIFQVYWFNKAWSLEEKQMSQSIKIALGEAADNIYMYNSIEPPVYNPVNQLTPGYFIVNIKSEIDANVLEHYLKSAFESSNIHIDYEYAIYDCQTNQMVYGNYINHQGDQGDPDTTKHLPTYNEYVYYFGVNFPTRNQYLLSGMYIWLVLSGILLIVISFFSYSLFIILKQKRLSEQQKEFINNMTHEFKTPIASINISADVLLDEKSREDPSRLSNYARIIKQENKRLNMQVERVLNIARIEKKGFHIKNEHIHAHEIIKEVKENSEITKGKENARVISSLAATNDIIFADRLHFTNIVFNLVDNAVKYSREEPFIEISTSNIKGGLELVIKDNGIGIQKEFQKKIFRKFYRVPTGNVHDVKGFGLGLYYVNSICKQHGWNLSLQSEVGKGSKFHIFIPQKKAND